MKKLLIVSVLMLGFSTINFAQQKVQEKNGVEKTKTDQVKIKENKMTGEVKRKDAAGTVAKTKVDLGKVSADKVKPSEKTTKIKTAETKTKTVQTIAPVKKEVAPGAQATVKKKLKKEDVHGKK